MNLLKINKINVAINDQPILEDLSLDINPGETHIIMGRNGSGKSTLVNTIMGNPDYKLISGTITFESESLVNLTTDQRAKLGIYLCMQNPPVIEGLSTAEMLRNNLSSKTNNFKLFEFVKNLELYSGNLGLKDEMLHRSINDGFSGGERKKNEVLQLRMLQPKLIILDEIDSGVDVDSLKIISREINDYILEFPKTSILIITHHSHILKYLEPDHVHILSKGNIIATGGVELVHQIEADGFEKTITCAVREWADHD